MFNKWKVSRDSLIAGEKPKFRGISLLRGQLVPPENIYLNPTISNWTIKQNRWRTTKMG